MKTMPRFLAALAFLALLLLPSPSRADGGLKPTEKPFLWVVEGETPSFLFGTIHLANDAILEFPQVVNDAFTASDALYTEIPMDMISMTRMATKVIAQPGETFGDAASPELRKRVHDYATSKGGSPDTLDAMKPWMVAVQLAIMGNPELIQPGKSVDQNLYNRAAFARKKLGALETIDSQVAVFEGFTLDEQLYMLGKSLDSLEEDEKAGRDSLRELMRLYLEGDEVALYAEMNRQYDPNDELMERFRVKLLDDRDKKMAENIDKAIRENPGRSHFFAVGALHFAGPYAVHKGLEARGHQVRRLGINDEIPSKKEAAAK
ncbi:MAG: TraB/GumN family protein [Candidatus Sumerlaeia bacterium]|nr:TraB/GumN family protein [Candidatus Sumerlaeia bacterium]